MLRITTLKNNYNSTKEGLILLDQNLVIIFISQIAVNLLKLEKEKILGTNILLYLSYKLRTSLIKKLKYLLNESYKINIGEKKLLLNLTNVNNVRFQISIEPNIIKNNLKAINLYIKPLIKTSKMLPLRSIDINNLSHELRAPLFNIKSFLETLYEYNSLLTSDQRLEFLEIATNETNRLNNLVKNILDFAELKNNKNSETSQFSINDIIEEIIQLNKLTAINKRIILSKEIDHSNKITLDSYTSLFHVISNLFNNSIKFTYPKGIIHIKTKKLGSNCLSQKSKKYVARVSIMDTGVGIGKKNAKNIFSRFIRGSKKSHIITGSGLGLPIIKEALSKKNQRLNFSSNVQKGSSASFNFYNIQ